MRSRLLLGLVVLVALVASAAPAQAAPGALNVLVTSNLGADALATEIGTLPGVASVATFDTSAGTPTAAELVPYDLIVSVGDSDYNDAATWGDRLADFVDAGGAVLQTAYDNWNEGSPAPTGRFAAGGYAPLLNGNNDNVLVTLGEIVIPGHPLLQGLGTFPGDNNTTTPLAPGATLVAKWSDGRNAIAFKGRVAATSAAPGGTGSVPDIARLAVNTGNFLGRHNVIVGKSGTGTGTVTSAPGGLDCGVICSAAFASGTAPALTATPAKNSYFSGWTGACTGAGACAPTIAGSDVSVGAAFSLAAFGKKTLVTLSAVSKKASSSGRVKVRVRNSNPFKVTGTLSGRAAGAKVKGKRFSVGAKSRKTVTLKLPAKARAALMRSGKVKVALVAKVKAPAGKGRTVKKRVTVKPKG